MNDAQIVESKIQCVERFYTACMNGEWDQAFKNVSRNVRYQHPGFRRPQGYATLRRHFEGFLQAFPDIQREVLLCFGQGDWVCVEERWWGTNTESFVRPNGRVSPPTRNAVDLSALGVYKVEDDMMTEIRLYEDLFSLRRQLRRRRRR